MRLVTFDTTGLSPRAGAIVDTWVIDLCEAGRATLKAGIPDSVCGILTAGEECLSAVSTIVGETRLSMSTGRPAPWAHELSSVHLRPPIPDPQKIICVGLNYRDHCLEQNVPVPKSPVIFSKFATSLVGPRDNIVLPKISDQIDPEVELAFVMGRAGRNIPEKRAMDYVAGYMVLNDLSARDIQYADKQWVRAKNFDTFAPCGPALVTCDEVPDPQNLKLELSLNGNRMQSSNTKQMIFGVAYLISFLSRSLTWTPGDIVSTGTPPGVGVFRKPPLFLKAGDKIVATVEGVGSIENTCVAE